MKFKAFSAIKMMTGSFTPYLLADWGEEEKEAAAGWLKGGSYPGFVEKIEGQIEAGLGQGWSARAVNMGRAAAQLALEALQLPAGAEVIMPPLSDRGLAQAVLQLGLNPVFADIDDQFALRYESVVEVASRNVKAVVIPHFCGRWTSDTDRIIEWARKRGVWVVEDARDAQGLVRKGGLAGTFGDAGVFSARGDRGIVSSGGGWVVTRNPRIARFIKEKELYPEPRAEVSERLDGFMKNCAVPASELGKRSALTSAGATGFKKACGGFLDCAPDRFKICSMSGIEARLLLKQLPKLAGNIEKRKQYAAVWRSSLLRLPLAGIRFQPEEDHVFSKMMLAFTVDEGEVESDILRRALTAGGVETAAGPEPLHKQQAYSRCRRGSMDFTDYRTRRAFYVPVWPGLGDADWGRIQKSLAESRGELVGK